MRIWALASNTFREAVRDRVLYSILFFAVGVLLLSVAVQELTIGDQAKVVRSVAQGAIDIFGSRIAMFLGFMPNCRCASAWAVRLPAMRWRAMMRCAASGPPCDEPDALAGVCVARLVDAFRCTRSR